MSRKKIIIKKALNTDTTSKKGSWKIAYSDFVTAMMAFFLVMWLISVSSKEDLAKMSSFFNMSNKESENSQNALGISLKQSSSHYANISVSLDKVNLEEFLARYKIDRKDEIKFRKIINNLRTHQGLQEFLENVFLDITKNGLRIQVVDSVDRPMFQPDTDMMQIYMKQTLSYLAEILQNEKNFFSIAGHTRKSSRKNSNDIWLLSFLRANQVRKFLVNKNHLFNNHILSVIGRADRDPMNIDDPEHPQNIRVEIILLNESSLGIKYKNMPYNFLE
ncbi:MAG: OmpA family protein [Rickettsia sp.]|nr:OmpA family protein [Rickettsia sp.]